MGRANRCRGFPSFFPILTVLGTLLCAPAADGQEAQAAGAMGGAGEPGSELTIYHVTMGAGDMVYEKFEHNALWVHDPVRGTDHVYNYGMFDFEQPGYWGRFVRGDWLYWLGVSDIRTTLYVYQYLNRTVIAQELDLTAAQRLELRDFLEWNGRDENRFYYYDYFYDNCSTRVRDALDRVLGGALHAATADSLTGTTFRWHSERLVADDLPVYTGLVLGLGPLADMEISAWEEMFLPGKVQEQLRRIRVPDGAGGTKPLVMAEHVMFEAVGREPLRTEPPARAGGFFIVGLLIGGTFAGLAGLARRNRAARIGLAGTTAIWSVLAGTGGLLLFVLWAFTNHTAAHRNENLLQFNPLMLALAVIVPALVLGATWSRRPAVVLSGAVLGLSLLGALLKLVPGFDQVNGELIALALPAHFGLAAAVALLALHSTPDSSVLQPPVSVQRPPRTRAVTKR